MIKVYRMLLDIMLPEERKRFWILVAITFVLSAFEAFSVVSVLPFLQVLAEPELIQTNTWLAWAYETLGFESVQTFLIAMGTAVFFLTVLGLLMKMVTIWLTTRFALMRSYSFSARLLSKYLYQDYEWFLSRRASDIGTSILSEIDRVVSYALLPAMRIIPEAFTLALLVLALCVIEPWIALGGAAIIGGVYGAIYLTVRQLMTRLGSRAMLANRARFSVVQESTGGLKELKVMGLETTYLKRFRDSAYEMANAQTQSQLIANTPRYALEAVAFGSMILLIIVLLVRGDGDLATLIPTLGLIAAVGLRLIPALQQLYLRGTAVRHGLPVLEKIHGDMIDLEEPKVPSALDAAEAEPRLSQSITLSGVKYSYPEADGAALHGMDMTIPARTAVGIVGGTGAGKTTLVDILLGLLVPDEGSLTVDGTPVTEKNRSAWQRRLGYVPQSIFLSDTTLAENIAFGLPRDSLDMAAVERAAKIAALHDFVMSDLPDGYDTLVGDRGVRLSGGQRQRVGIARALYHNPDVLIFDEATSALDTVTEALVMEAVERIAGEKTIIMIAHRLSTVRNCDTIFLLSKGQVAAAGQFEELTETSEQFRELAAGLMPVSSSK